MKTIILLFFVSQFMLQANALAQSTSCEVQLGICPNHLTHNNLLIQDNYYGSGSDQNLCLERAAQFAYWCGTDLPITSRFRREGVVVATKTVPVPTISTSFKMTDYWEKPRGSGLVKMYDNGQSSHSYLEGDNVLLLNDYVHGEYVDTWHLRFNHESGEVREFQDDFATDGQRTSYIYDPSFEIIWGSTLTIGQTETGLWGNSRIGRNHIERITLTRHYDSLTVGRHSYNDVIVIRVFQDYGSGTVQADYYLQRGFGFIKVDYFDEGWTKTATVQLTKRCEATRIPQISCP